MSVTDPVLDLPHPLRERVELIIHLLKFSDRLFAIMSPATEELVSFADLLVKEGEGSLRFARVHLELATTAEDVTADLARSWGIEVALGESAQQAISLRLPKLIPEPRRAVAILEDVERLPTQALDQLINFMQRLDAETQGRVRLVLLGSPNLTQRLQSLPSLEAGGQIYALHLAPPPAESFADLMTGAFGHTSPTPERVTPPTTGLFSPRILLLGGGALSLVLAVIVALLMRADPPTPPKEEQVSLPIKPPLPANVSPSNRPSTPVPYSEPGPSVSTAPIGHQLSEAGALPAPASTPLPQDHKPSLPNTLPETKPAPTASLTLAESKPNAPSPKPITPALTPSVESKSSTPPPKPNPNSTPSAKKTDNWYAQQKGEHYVLQVISAKSETEAERFIKQQGLKDCHSFRQVREGQTLHTVTCGIYPNREAATQALNKLPEKVRTSRPFPRKIDDIRRIMLP